MPLFFLYSQGMWWLKWEIKSFRVREITNYKDCYYRRFPNVKKHERLGSSASGKFFSSQLWVGTYISPCILVLDQLITIPAPTYCMYWRSFPQRMFHSWQFCCTTLILQSATWKHANSHDQGSLHDDDNDDSNSSVRQLRSQLSKT